MADVLDIKLVRPYATLDDFIEGDSWTVERTGLLLVGRTDIEPKKLVRFEIVLESGDAAVSGEGRVVEVVRAVEDRPGGVRIQFRKLDSRSKRVLKRALEHQKNAGCAVDEAPANGTTPPESAAQSEMERSGVHHKPRRPVQAPDNRDSLLDRLRERARNVEKTRAVEADLDEAAEG